MANIRLCAMTLSLCREYFQQFVYDADVFIDAGRITEFRYHQEYADQYYQRQKELQRVHLAILLDNTIIGEIILKNIKSRRKCCTMGIHLINDTYKNKGYGTTAETLALAYAFEEMEMKTVFADAILKNQRSQHVLEKAGFRETHRDDTFVYYRCDRSSWSKPI